MQSALISPQSDGCCCTVADLEIVRQHSAVRETCLVILCLWCTISYGMLDVRKARGECSDKLSWCERDCSNKEEMPTVLFPVDCQGSCVYHRKGLFARKQKFYFIYFIHITKYISTDNTIEVVDNLLNKFIITYHAFENSIWYIIN